MYILNNNKKVHTKQQQKGTYNNNKKVHTKQQQKGTY